MPIWLRNFTFNKIKEFYSEEKKQTDKLSNSSTSGKITPPNFKQPNYTAKASKK